MLISFMDILTFYSYGFFPPTFNLGHLDLDVGHRSSPIGIQVSPKQLDKRENGPQNRWKMGNQFINFLV